MILAADTRKLGLGALVASLSLALLVAAPPAGAKKKGGGQVEMTNTASVAIPDENPPFADGVDGVVNSTIVVGKQAAGRVIRDVNVTVRTQGTSNHTPPAPAVFNGPTEAFDLVAIFRAPNGAHTTLFANLTPPLANAMAFAPFPSIGPLTLDDEAGLALGFLNPHDPFELYAPFAGTARPDGRALAIMDNGPVRGTWTLTMLDILNTGTSSVSSWGIDVTAGKPYRTK